MKKGKRALLIILLVLVLLVVGFFGWLYIPRLMPVKAEQHREAWKTNDPFVFVHGLSGWGSYDAQYKVNLLNQQLNIINNSTANGNRPELTITYFIPDEHKAGGRYASVTARVKRIDTAARQMILMVQNQTDIPETISFDRIFSLQGDLVDTLSDIY